jgi:hypothetical protein
MHEPFPTEAEIGNFSAVSYGFCMAQKGKITALQPSITQVNPMQWNNILYLW